MKKILIPIIIAAVIISGCNNIEKNKNNAIENTMKKSTVNQLKKANQSEKPDEKNNLSINEEERKSIEDIIKIKQTAVISKNIDMYMKTINEKDKEYYAEQKHWFEDIQVSNIENYSLKVKEISKVNENTFLVSLEQRYKCNYRGYVLRFKQVYKPSDEGLKDCDLDFKSIETEHFVIKYFEGFKPYADEIGKSAEGAYEIVKNNYGEVPKDKTVIKLYSDRELLRQSAKLSIAFTFVGWYEYPESIKYLNPSSITSRTSGVIAHEMIHKVTINQSKNNMPYWVSEGLAEYFSTSENLRAEFKGNKSIKELQNMELEKLEDGNEISQFYSSSKSIVKFIIDKYGVDKVKEILDELGKYPLQEKTGSEVDKENQKTFAVVLQKVLGITIDELDEQWKSYKKQY